MAIRVSAFLLVIAAFLYGQGLPLPAIQRLNTLPAQRITDIVVDKAGQIYVVGITSFSSFPVTPNGFQTKLIGTNNVFFQEGFLVKLDSTGTRVLYDTFLSGLVPNKVAVDDAGFMYVLADHNEQAPDDIAYEYPASLPFPISKEAAQTDPGFPVTSVVAKFASSGELVYSTFVGGVRRFSHRFPWRCAPRVALAYLSDLKRPSGVLRSVQQQENHEQRTGATK